MYTVTQKKSFLDMPMGEALSAIYLLVGFFAFEMTWLYHSKIEKAIESGLAQVPYKQRNHMESLKEKHLKSLSFFLALFFVLTVLSIFYIEYYSGLIFSTLALACFIGLQYCSQKALLSTLLITAFYLPVRMGYLIYMNMNANSAGAHHDHESSHHPEDVQDMIMVSTVFEVLSLLIAAVTFWLAYRYRLAIQDWTLRQSFTLKG
jgi:hypothetical protein